MKSINQFYQYDNLEFYSICWVCVCVCVRHVVQMSEHWIVATAAAAIFIQSEENPLIYNY